MQGNYYQQMTLGPLEPLLQDPNVTEVMVNGLNGVWIVRHGRLEKTDVQFASEEQIVNIIQLIVGPMGRRADEASPLVDARLADGSRVNAVVRPIALSGPTLTISKFIKDVLRVAELVEYGALSQEMADFLRAAVQGLKNIVISGGIRSGKTTVLNALSEFFRPMERVITIETVAELALRHDHVIMLETRPPARNGEGEVTMADLIINAQRMLPERIVSGEVRSGEAWDMLQVMALGYEGSMFTVFANSAAEALERLEVMSTAASGLPLLQIRGRMVQAIHLITNQQRMADGVRRVTSISEVIGLQAGNIELREVFRFEPTGEQDGRIIGTFRKTGYRPTFADALDLPEDFFDTSG